MAYTLWYRPRSVGWQKWFLINLKLEFKMSGPTLELILQQCRLYYHAKKAYSHELQIISNVSTTFFYFCRIHLTTFNPRGRRQLKVNQWWNHKMWMTAIYSWRLRLKFSIIAAVYLITYQIRYLKYALSKKTNAWSCTECPGSLICLIITTK